MDFTKNSQLVSPQVTSNGDACLYDKQNSAEKYTESLCHDDDIDFIAILSEN
jgi:hypothetical protein